MKFRPEDDCYRVLFGMHSHYLNEEDRKHIFDEGYSGEYAIKEGTKGHGYGMYRAKRLLRQCDADIEIAFGDSEGELGGVEYAYNEFSISLPYPD